jgi:hypothetical protein
VAFPSETLPRGARSIFKGHLLAVWLATLATGLWFGWFWPNQAVLIVLFLILLGCYGYEWHRL